MKKLFTIAIACVTINSYAEPRYYAEYKNNASFVDSHYINNSSINSARLGITGDALYFEAGAAERDGETGYSFETGYKFKFKNQYEVKVKIEGIDVVNDKQTPWKTEAEFRYYFN